MNSWLLPSPQAPWKACHWWVFSTWPRIDMQWLYWLHEKKLCSLSNVFEFYRNPMSQRQAPDILQGSICRSVRWGGFSSFLKFSLLWTSDYSLVWVTKPTSVLASGSSGYTKVGLLKPLKLLPEHNYFPVGWVWAELPKSWRKEKERSKHVLQPTWKGTGMQWE